MRYNEYKKEHECIKKLKFIQKKKDIVSKIYMYYNEYKLEVRVKKENEALIVRNVAVLGDKNSGKSAIFAKALNLD
jgi:hypothetical protein